MPNYESMNPEGLRVALARAQAFLQDAIDERSFLGKQTSMHIKVAELVRLDQDVERFGARVDQLKALLADQAA